MGENEDMELTLSLEIIQILIRMQYCQGGVGLLVRYAQVVSCCETESGCEA